MLKKLKINAKEWSASQRSKYQAHKSFKKLIMCKKCYTFYYKNSWHFFKPKNVVIDHNEEIPVKFTECSACMEQETASFVEREFAPLEMDSRFAL